MGHDDEQYRSCPVWNVASWNDIEDNIRADLQPHLLNCTTARKLDSSSVRCDCPFRIERTYGRSGQDWTVKEWCGESITQA